MSTTRTIQALAGLIAAAGTLPAQLGLNPADPTYNAHNGGVVKIFHIGPVTVPAGQPVNGKVVPGEYDRVVPAPHPGDVYMTSFNSRIVDLSRVATKPAELYLHHCVLMNRSVRDMTCAFAPERFAAAGAERIPIMLPPGYGYRIRPADAIVATLHIQNYTLKAQTVYYQYSMTLQPASAGLKTVRPWWLDVVNCTSSYTIAPGTSQHTKTATFTVPQNMDVLTMAPHLHCYGAYLDLHNLTTQKLVHHFVNRRQCEVDMLAVLLQPALPLTKGHSIKITAVYNRQPNDPIDAMGIMLAYVVLK